MNLLLSSLKMGASDVIMKISLWSFIELEVAIISASNIRTARYWGRNGKVIKAMSISQRSSNKIQPFDVELQRLPTADNGELEIVHTTYENCRQSLPPILDPQEASTTSTVRPLPAEPVAPATRLRNTTHVLDTKANSSGIGTEYLRRRRVSL